MAAVPKKIAERVVAGIKRYQPIVAAAKARDVGEADTVTIIKDMLADVFGYDKYSDVTSEYAIRGTYCDLAIKLDGQLQTLIEVKSIGLDLKESHVKQAIDYVELTRFGGHVDVSAFCSFLHAASRILPDVGSVAAGGGSAPCRTLAWRCARS